MIENGFRPRILLTAWIPEHELAPLPVFSHHVCGGDPQHTMPFPAPLDELAWRRQEWAFLTAYHAHPGFNLIQGGYPVFFKRQHPLSADLIHVFLAAVNGVLGYEAQLVNAVISRSGVLASRFEYEWYGPWEKVVGKFHIRKGDKGEYRVPGWTLADEAGIGIIIRATLKGEDQPRELDLLLAQARTRNSTLWADDPRQQLAYLAVKRWARLFCPDVILGVYTPDELDDRREEREVNPAPTQHVSLADISGDNVTTTQTAQESAQNIDALADDFRDRIEAAQDVDSAKALRADIETVKATLGSALFTELKNKAVKRYYLVDARNKVEAAINSLPSPDEPGAAERFGEAERVLASVKRHLGEELHDQFSITLADMKPEYVD